MTYKIIGQNRSIRYLVKTLEQAYKETGIPHHFKKRGKKIYIEAEEVRFPRSLEVEEARGEHGTIRRATVNY